MLRKRLVSFSLSVLLFLGVALPVQATNVSKSSKSAVQSQVQKKNVNGIKEKDLQKYFEKHDISKDKQKKLTEKVKKNELWDCYKQEEQSKIPEDFFLIDLNSTNHKKTYTFDDGSIIEVSVEVPEEQLNRSVNSGDIMLFGSREINGGTEYWDVKIDRMVGALVAWFYADFFVAPEGTPSYITNVFESGITGFGATENPTEAIIREKEDIDKSRSALAASTWFVQAEVSGSWGWFSGSIPVGSTCKLYLALIRGKVYVDTKLPY